MPPHGSTMPAPMTESAREARKAFYCDLCSKGYSRVNEFEAHEGSYDHLHKKRLKDMKVLSRDPTSRARALKAEARANELSGGGVKGIVIKPIAKSGGFRKGGFRNAFGGEGAAGGDKEGGRGGDDKGKVDVEVMRGKGDGDGKGEDGGMGLRGRGEVEGKGGMEEEESEDDGDGEGEGLYDPRRPTGCEGGCEGL